MFPGDEEEGDKPDGEQPPPSPGAEPLPETLTDEQTTWFDALAESNVMEVKELMDSGQGDTSWKNKVRRS